MLEAQSTESRYSYRIETRGEQAFRGWLHPGIDLPNRLPLGQELLDKDGKSVHSPSGGHPKLTASLGGKGSGGTTSVGGVEKIRFVIAVNASHHKIPFELDDIPLPSLPAASTEEPSRQQSK